MKNNFRLTALIFLLTAAVHAQTIYVDAINGNDKNTGAKDAPFKSIIAAVDTANKLSANEAITVILKSGTYVLEDRVDVNPLAVFDVEKRFTITAEILPGDKDWELAKMPVVLSTSGYNSKFIFEHAAGFLINTSHVSIKGIKFLGNPNPSVGYYYPITKPNKMYTDLEVSQCVFVGDKEAGKIQGAVWIQGKNNKVEHSVFYGCRNAILFFDDVAGMQITNNIIAKSYESAFWFPQEDVDVTFKNNILLDNEYVVVKPDMNFSSVWENSLLLNNANFAGKWSREEQKILELKKSGIPEKNITRKGNAALILNEETLPENDHLQLKEGSAGAELKAGLFKE